MRLFAPKLDCEKHRSTWFPELFVLENGISYDSLKTHCQPAVPTLKYVVIMECAPAGYALQLVRQPGFISTLLGWSLLRPTSSVDSAHL